MRVPFPMRAPLPHARPLVRAAPFGAGAPFGPCSSFGPCSPLAVFVLQSLCAGLSAQSYAWHFSRLFPLIGPSPRGGCHFSRVVLHRPHAKWQFFRVVPRNAQGGGAESFSREYSMSFRQFAGFENAYNPDINVRTGETSRITLIFCQRGVLSGGARPLRRFSARSNPVGGTRDFPRRTAARRAFRP